MTSSTPSLAGLSAAALLALSGCDKPPEAPARTVDVVFDAAVEASGEASSDTSAEADETLAAATDAAVVVPESGGGASSDADASIPADTLGDPETLDALVDEGEIPYPVYPNGAKYRVGGENGLKIVLFETTDSFEEVDAYFGDRAEEAGMPRLAAMNDYVRYSRETDDDDPWATHRPGIVIHRFGDDEARDAVGADPSARTNIIMSY